MGVGFAVGVCRDDAERLEEKEVSRGKGKVKRGGEGGGGPQNGGRRGGESVPF